MPKLAATAPWMPAWKFALRLGQPVIRNPRPGRVMIAALSADAVVDAASRDASSRMFPRSAIY